LTNFFLPFAELIGSQAPGFPRTFMASFPQPINMTSVRSNFITFISSTFIFLFVYTALSKLRELRTFIHVLGSSPLIDHYNYLVGWTIPLFELAVAVLLFLPATKRLGMYCALGLVTLFTLYVAYMITFVPHLPCSCGGVIQQLSWRQHLALNCTLTLMAAMAAFQHKFFVATDRRNRKPVTE
jgi:hypothetical protein